MLRLSENTNWQRQKGITLLESLIAIIILALGVLGLVAIQSRMVAETRISNSRATAIRLISDLNERIMLNRSAVNSYRLAADTDAASTSKDACDSSCSLSKRAEYDIWQWQQNVRNAFPGALTVITPSTSGNGRQLVVVIGWNPNEKNPGSTIPAGFRISGDDIPKACSSTKICHLQYLELPFLPPLPGATPTPPPAKP